MDRKKREEFVTYRGVHMHLNGKSQYFDFYSVMTYFHKNMHFFHIDRNAIVRRFSAKVMTDLRTIKRSHVSVKIRLKNQMQ